MRATEQSKVVPLATPDPLLFIVSAFAHAPVEGVAHVPSPRQNVLDVADVPLLSKDTGTYAPVPLNAPVNVTPGEVTVPVNVGLAEGAAPKVL